MVDWKLYIDSPQQRALKFCGGSLDRGGGVGTNVEAGGDDGYGWGRGYGWSPSDGSDRSRTYGDASTGDGFSSQEWR